MEYCIFGSALLSTCPFLAYIGVLQHQTDTDWEPIVIKFPFYTWIKMVHVQYKLAFIEIEMDVLSYDGVWVRLFKWLSLWNHFFLSHLEVRESILAPL